MMENEIPVRVMRNIAPRKMETKIKTGPVLYRPALGSLHNKQSYQANVDPKKNQTNAFKKIKSEKSLPNKTALPSKSLKVTSGKENIPAVVTSKRNAVIPVDVPSKIKEETISKTEEETMGQGESPMEVDEVDVEELSVAFSSDMLGIRDIDEDDTRNPQLVSAYVKNIYKYLWELEDRNAVNVHYLEGMKVTSRMRAILIDWLVQVHLRFSLVQETLYLTVGIIDRFLQVRRTITKDQLQLVGVTAMYLACKYEEMYIPEIGDFTYITDKSFTNNDIRRMEVVILKSLDYFISFPLPLHFLRRNSKAGHVDGVHHSMAKYLMELTLPEYSFSHYKASMLAAAALYLSLKLVDDGPNWDEVMTHYSNYSEKDILPLVHKLSALVIRSNSSKQQAIRSKYKASKFMKISDLPQLKLPSRLLKNYAEKASLT